MTKSMAEVYCQEVDDNVKNDAKAISLVVREPKAIIIDLMGTALKTGFIDKIMRPYVKDNIESYLDKKWKDKQVKKVIDQLRKEAESGSFKIAANKAPEQEQKESVIEYMETAIDSKNESSGAQALAFTMFFDGYEKGKVKKPIYSDVIVQMKKWKENDLKIYIVTKGWKEATRKFLGTTLTVDDIFDTSDGKLDNKDTYKKIAKKIKLPLDKCLFLTKSGAQGLTASQAGMDVVLVIPHRKYFEKLSEKERSLSRVRSFYDINFGDVTTTMATTPE